MWIKKSRVLAILKVAPPLTGATSINQSIIDSAQKWLGGELEFKTISYASSIQDLGSYNLKKFLKFFLFLFSISKSLIVQRPQVVYFQMSIYGASFYRDSVIILLAKLTGRKVLVHLHGKGMRAYGESHVFYRFWISFLLKRQFAVVLTEGQKKDVDWIGLREIAVIPNGISIPEGVEKKWVAKAAKEPIRWLFLSNLLQAKGIDDVLKLAVILKENNVPFEGVLVGKEGDRDAAMINAFIRENELEGNLFYHGALYDQEKWRAISKADILIFPTYNEAFGIVAIEAMGVGIPVIAYREGGLVEIIEPGKNGKLVEKGNINGLFQQVLYFQQNPDLLQAYGSEARKLFYSKFTSDTFMTKLYTEFDHVIAFKK
jgi:glycosyltransferase involved in cell wall biosynthesis